MMKIICKEKPQDLMRYPDDLFKVLMERDWFNDSLVEEMVLSVDKTHHIKDFVFDSPVLGAIPPDYLSSGVKGLIGIYKCQDFRDFEAISSIVFGDNCVKWLAKLSFLVDFTIYYEHPLDFGTRGTGDHQFQNEPVNAVGENGEKLLTCFDVIKYYFDNFKGCCYE